VKDMEAPSSVAGCYRCPACFQPLPVWAVENCFPDSEFARMCACIVSFG
jgi:hypothetical protein